MSLHEWIPLLSCEWLTILGQSMKETFAFDQIPYWIEILSWIIFTDFKWVWNNIDSRKFWRLHKYVGETFEEEVSSIGSAIGSS